MINEGAVAGTMGLEIHFFLNWNELLARGWGRKIKIGTV